MLRGARVGADRGSIIPFVLLACSLAALMVCGGITASAAFLAQRDLQSVCDGAALAAANAVDEGRYFDVGSGQEVPLSEGSVRSAVAGYLATAAADRPVTWSAATDGRTVEVSCVRWVDVPFDALFLGGQPLERSALASARAPTTG